MRLAIAVLCLTIATIGCSKSDSGSSSPSSSSDSGATELTGAAKEARDFAMTEVQKRWTKSANGWITARTLGSSFAPDHVLREIKEITPMGVDTNELGESDKMNGFEFAGEVGFKKVPVREIGDPGVFLDGASDMGASIMRQKNQWTQWVDYLPEAIKVQKVKGKWQVHEDTWLLRGTMPTPQDYANAGVKP